MRRGPKLPTYNQRSTEGRMSMAEAEGFSPLATAAKGLYVQRPKFFENWYNSASPSTSAMAAKDFLTTASALARAEKITFGRPLLTIPQQQNAFTYGNSCVFMDAILKMFNETSHHRKQGCEIICKSLYSTNSYV